MIRAERIMVGEEPIDLTEGSGGSGVTIQWLRNASNAPGRRPDQTAFLLIGGDEDGENPIPLGAGESGLQGLVINSADHLHVRSEKGEIPVDIVLGWA